MRDLPWRDTRDPYAIWVSEIMLQQTQVATVVPYFGRFLAAFPSIRALARADEHDVLRHWEGLGYYRRARQMHRAARVLAERHGAKFPRDLEAVRDLPGIGRYTAGAIVSIAFDLPAPILEANTVRLLSRLVGDRNGASPRGLRRLWELAERILPRRNCGEFNQALMELGSLVCRPRAPDCSRCPVRLLCAACARGLQDQIPAGKAKPRSERVREACVAVWRGNKVLLRKRTAGERWAGLWDFLRFQIEDGQREQSARLVENIRLQSGLAVPPPRHFATLKHGVTRFRITLDCYAAHSPRGKPKAGETFAWVRPAELGRYALSMTGRKIGRLLADELHHSG
jgi:A/G-specific adenine glycosylase